MYRPQLISDRVSSGTLSRTTPTNAPQTSTEQHNVTTSLHNQDTQNYQDSQVHNYQYNTSGHHGGNEDRFSNPDNVISSDTKNHHKNNNNINSSTNHLTQYEVEFGRKLAKRLGYFSIVNLLDEFIAEFVSDNEGVIEILDSDLDMSLTSYDVPETIVDTLPDIHRCKLAQIHNSFNYVRVFLECFFKSHFLKTDFVQFNNSPDCR